MHAFVMLLVAGSGTYQVEEGASFTVNDGVQATSCIAAAPSATFAIEGPAGGRLIVRVDLPKRGKAKPLAVSVTLDGKRKVHRLRPKRAKNAVYDPEQEQVPSRPAAPIPLRVTTGSHRLVVSVAARRSVCVTIEGLAAKAATLATAPVAPPAEPAPPPPPPVISAQVEAQPPAADELALQNDSASDKAATLEPAPAATAAGMREIRAAAVEESASSDEARAGAAPAASGDLLRVGAVAGGVLPRGEIKPGFVVGLLVDLPVAVLAGTELSVFGEAGMSPMRQQQATLIPGRGKTELIQNALVFPCEVGARARWSLGDSLFLHAALGLAVDIVRAEMHAFSTEVVEQNDVALGVGAGAGIFVPVGPGGFVAEARYRETRADLGTFNDVAEQRLGRSSLHVGYLVALSR